MSHSKSGFGSRDWHNVSCSHRCPICDKPDWCSVHKSGEAAMCRRVSHGGTHYVDGRGESFWIHLLSERVVVPPEVHIVTPNRATPDDLHHAYCLLLGQLDLSDKHRQHLRNRGLTDDQIMKAGYSTLPLEGRARLAKFLTPSIPGDVLEIPGIYIHDDPKRSWLSFAGCPGLVIPCRDSQGRIIALKVRRDDDSTPKYTYISSARHGGPGPLHSVHWPVFDGCYSELRITEGPLKADVATVLGKVYTIGLPGVGSWRMVLDQWKDIRALDVQTIRIAFDADWRTNPQVRAALDSLVTVLRQQTDKQVKIDKWEPSLGKGIDDALLNWRMRRAS